MTSYPATGGSAVEADASFVGENQREAGWPFVRSLSDDCIERTKAADRVDDGCLAKAFTLVENDETQRNTATILPLLLAVLCEDPPDLLDRN